MSRKSYGYGSYRGRSGAGGVLKGIVLFLFVVLILAVAAFFYLQQYMVFEDDGSSHLELPFFQRESHPPDDLPTPSAPVVQTAQPSPTPTPDPTPQQAAVRPVVLAREALYDGTAADAVTEGGGNAALFDMKWDTGELGWVTDQPLAITAQLSAADPAVNVAIQAAAGEDGVYRIARISCFKDNLLSNADTSLAILTNSGYRWTDTASVRWISPTNETVRAYLTALCVELSGLGFDEILLDNAGYPTQGKLGYIRKGQAYNAQEFEPVISGFYAQVAQALEGSDTRLSVVFDPDTSALSGQTEAGIRAAHALPVLLGADGSFFWPDAAAAQPAVVAVIP